MLVAVEAYFHSALKAALGGDAVVSTGPAADPGSEVTALVEIVASRLTVSPDNSAEAGEPAGRGPAFHVRVHRFAADGTSRDFLLPAQESGEIIEVQSPPGRLLTRGDDYQVEGPALRFYLPPAQGADAVLVRVRGARARGYTQRLAAQIDLTIRVWTRERARADDLGRRVLAATLMAAAAAELGVIDGCDPATPAVGLRFLRGSAALSSLRRGLGSKEPMLHTTDLEFILRGELEETVALGDPEPTSIIRAVRAPND